ncbi:MAG: M56 family metallopeptidase [Planctomycetota bacterium]|jgi:beta-lactamase regulating signal transducer with metallopeptidase domain
MSDLAEHFLPTLARTTLLLSATALLVGLLLWKLRCRRPTLHRAAWCVVLLQGWLFLQMPVSIPWYEAPPRIATEPSAAAPPSVEGWPGATGADVEQRSASPRSAEISAPPPSPSPGGDRLTATAPVEQPLVNQPTESRRWSWPLMLVAVWLAGMAVVALRWTLNYVGFVRRLPPGEPAEPAWARQWEVLLTQSGVRKPIPLHMTAHSGPMLCRLPGRCHLVLPIGLWRVMSPDERLAVLRHELAHWKRSDALKSLVVRLLALPHWFNPAAWWAVRSFEEAAEWACDREATGTDPEEAVRYARVLLRVSRPEDPSHVLGAAARGRGTAVRLKRLLTPQTVEEPVMKRLLVMTVALGLVVVGLLRVDLVAKDSTPAGSAADSSAEATEKAPASEPQARQKVPLHQLRYDGKTFDQWKIEWKTELKPERRAEAINAFAAFGANGYGEEAASAILEVMRGFEMRVNDKRFSSSDFKQKAKPSGNKLIKQSAIAAFLPVLPAYRIPPADGVAVLARELKEGPRNGRLFAVFVLENMAEEGMGEEREAAAKVLRNALDRDPDATVRCCAYSALADVQPDFQIPAKTLREIIDDADSLAMQNVLNSLVPSMGTSAGSIFEKEPQAAYGPGYGAGGYSVYGGYGGHGGPPRNLRPEAQPIIDVLLDSLGSQKAAVRHQAIWALGRCGREAKQAVPALVGAFEKGDPSDRGVILQTLQTLGQSSGSQPLAVNVIPPEEQAPAFDPGEVVPKLIQALDPRDPGDLRLMGHLGSTFGQAGQKAARPVLEKAAEDEDEQVRRTAKQILEAMPDGTSRRRSY